ncbi:TRAP transporter substrate-binding protein [Neobacillus mesonae]|uniref:TRAP transporter substrate-binding protein n=1 Tax=Neobacillus mesonae TaxID=1193713 RepID=UPI0020402B4D|nr:TRAP transporter substrate-binding protein [Neobacillus mesonae]MCM3571011.1 TRAP transporter substrate-binding protein [Neobacillus mesonae]
MKKISKVLFLGLICVMLVALSACGNGGKTEKASGDSKDSKGKIVIKFAHSAVEANSRHKAALMFKKLVEEKSKGEMTVEVFPNEVLGSEPQMVEAVSFNDIQMVAASTFAQYEPKVDAFGLPFLFETNEQAWKAIDGPIGQKVFEPLLDDNLRVLGHLENGFRNVTNNEKPINSAKDLKGMKIRTPEQPVLVSIFKALGANPTPMAFGELYMALQQGTVDGQENPVANIYASKFNEVQKYLSLTKHSYSPVTVAISDKFWQTLTKEQQDIIASSVKEVSKWHRETVVKEEAGQIKELESKGMKVNTPTDMESFREAVKPVYKEYEKTYGKDLIDSLLNSK